MTRAATYIRTAPNGSNSSLPDRDRQLASVIGYAARCGYEVVASYEDRGAPGEFLYHKPALKEAIRNVKELEDWAVLVACDPRCLSETASARHELVHKFALYGNRIECPEKGWEELEAEMRLYRREMAGR
ncbi:recombinase family protein [Rubrobacter indicoceani]|uniref:recombinase family protein n=1 Tax=Rubrobacter indicoceani TaxID=2051957 RepID=UPI0013C4E0F8|nr:recombinase family protein [Rubrobacter indicoceani]